MNKKQLNQMVMQYQNGDEYAMEAIFNAVNPLIEKASAEIERFVDEFTKFDCRTVVELKRLIKTFDGEKHDFLSSAKAVIDRTKSQYIRRDSRKSELHTSMEFLAEPQGDALGYQFEDTLASVEDEVMFNEKIALLAEGDSRKTTILIEWARGAEDKSISELLAQLFGGNPTGHRSFIKRFKSKCQDRLAAEMTL